MASAPGLTPELRREFLDLIQQRLGMRNSEYLGHRLDAAVDDLLTRTSCADAAALLNALRSEDGHGLLEALALHLTVGETYFYRDPALVAALQTLVLPDILQRRAFDRRLRIWSAGCSTGEEPYTVAILLEQQAFKPQDWEVLLVGTDVNRASLRAAREGVYHSWSFRAVSEEFRQRYFQPTGASNRWQLTDRIRRLVQFASTNLAADPLTPPAADMDLILCRNVTIYFDADTTQRLYSTLIEALAPGGWLVLGPSDPLPTRPHALERVEAGDTVLWRRPAAESNAREPRRPGGYPARRLPASRPVLTVRKDAPVQKLKPRPARPTAGQTHGRVATPDGDDALRAGLLALEAGSYASALQWLRRATFRDPNTPVGQFALASAYLGLGDTMRAQAALVYADRLLAGVADDDLAPVTDTLSAATLREAVKAHLAKLASA